MSFKLFPGDRFTLRSNLKPDEIRRRLAEKVSVRRTARQTFSRDTRTAPYEGRLGLDDFEISRIITHRNSFLPQIRGRITDLGAYTDVIVRMQPVAAVQIFLAIWMCGVGFACVTVVIADFKKWQAGDFSPFVLVPFLMLGFAYAMSHLAFRSESRNSKKFLEDLLEAYPISETQ